MKPGIYHNLPFDEYAAIPAISNTALGKMNPPARYKEWLDNPVEEVSTALRIGRIAHRAILEPDKWRADFENFYAVKPDGMRFSTKEGKAWRYDAEEDNREIITHAESDFLTGAVESIASHKTAREMLSCGKPEVSLVSDYNGIPTKARIDWLTEGDGNAIIDLKTAESADPNDFDRAILNYRYFVQGAFYLDVARSLGLPVEHFCILAVEKKRPYLVSCHRITEEYIDIGRTEYVRRMGVYAECKRSGVWPGFKELLYSATPPQWLINKQAA